MHSSSSITTRKAQPITSLSAAVKASTSKVHLKITIANRISRCLLQLRVTHTMVSNLDQVSLPQDRTNLHQRMLLKAHKDKPLKVMGRVVWIQIWLQLCRPVSRSSPCSSISDRGPMVSQSDLKTWETRATSTLSSRPSSLCQTCLTSCWHLPCQVALPSPTKSPLKAKTQTKSKERPSELSTVCKWPRNFSYFLQSSSTPIKAMLTQQAS